MEYGSGFVHTLNIITLVTPIILVRFTFALEQLSCREKHDPTITNLHISLTNREEKILIVNLTITSEKTMKKHLPR